MAELTTLARPYAKAAFEQAKSEKDLSSWSKALALVAMVSVESKVKVLFSSPNLTSEEKSAAFIGFCKEELSETQQNFLRILSENNRLDLLVQVYELFELYKSNQEKSVDVEIHSAFEVSSEIEEKLAKSLSKKLDRVVSLKTTIDKSLIGGALIRAGDTVIDGSVRGRLASLAESLNI